MRLTNITILALKGSGQSIKEKIAEATKVTPSTVYRWILSNDENLTKASALKVIREELNLTDAQILEDDSKDRTANIISENP